MQHSKFALEYNPDVLESIIDKYRFEQRWADVLPCIERYAHIFNSGASVGTKQHPDIRSVKAYYWVCLAEIKYYLKSDFVESIDCLRRAMLTDEKYADSKIVCCAILIDKTKALLGCDENPSSSKNKNLVRPHSVGEISFDSIDLAFIMGDLYQVRLIIQ